MQTLNLIGAGRVGQTLGWLWQQQSVFAVQDVLTRSPASAQAACDFMGGGTPVGALAAMRAADVWMLAVPDAQIAAVAQSLAGLARPPATVFHCSGAQSAALLRPLSERGWHSASAHCILSFASTAAATRQFPGTVCALEGEATAIALLHSAFTAIGAQCFEVPSQHKQLYHAAAVFATNFLPVLQQVAEEAWLASGVPPALLPGLRSALLHNAVDNILRAGPRAALTGPAARGDVAAIATQAAAVAQWDAQAADAYLALSAVALRMGQRQADTPTPPPR